MPVHVSFVSEETAHLILVWQYTLGSSTSEKALTWTALEDWNWTPIYPTLVDIGNHQNRSILSLHIIFTVEINLSLVINIFVGPRILRQTHLAEQMFQGTMMSYGSPWIPKETKFYLLIYFCVGQQTLWEAQFPWVLIIFILYGL